MKYFYTLLFCIFSIASFAMSPLAPNLTNENDVKLVFKQDKSDYDREIIQLNKKLSESLSVSLSLRKIEKEYLDFVESLETIQSKISIFLHTEPRDKEELLSEFDKLLAPISYLTNHPTQAHSAFINSSPKSTLFGDFMENSSVGFISGITSYPEIKEDDDRILFSVKVGKQTFRGSLKLDDISDCLILESTAALKSQIAFSLSRPIASLPFEQVKKEWNELMLSDSLINPTRFISKTTPAPQGFQIYGAILYPIYFNYISVTCSPLLKINSLVRNSNDSPINIGYFIFTDGSTEKPYRKYITSSQLDGSIKFTIPNGLVVNINADFDYFSTWKEPLVLWNMSIPSLKLMKLAEFIQTNNLHQMKRQVVSGEELWSEFISLSDNLLCKIFGVEGRKAAFDLLA